MKFIPKISYTFLLLSLLISCNPQLEDGKKDTKGGKLDVPVTVETYPLDVCGDLSYLAQYECGGGTFTAKKRSDLDQYLQTFGTDRNKKGRAQDLRIDFDVTGDIDRIISPCDVTLTRNEEVNVSGNLCIAGGGVVNIDSDPLNADGDLEIISFFKRVEFKQNANISAANLKITADDKIKIDNKSKITAGDWLILTTSGDKKSNIDIDNKSILSAQKVSITTPDLKLDNNVTITASDKLSITPIGTKTKLKVDNGAVLESDKIEITGFDDTRFSNGVTIVADNLVLDGGSCSLDKNINVQAQSTSGSCFTSTKLVAKFILSQPSSIAPSVVHFDASSSKDAIFITKYVWKPEQGVTIETSTPILDYTYYSPGNYNPELSIFDQAGNSATYSMALTVSGTAPANLPPLANFDYTNDKVINPNQFVFNASSSVDPEGSSLQFRWTFESGEVIDTSDPILNKTFAEAGKQTVRLEVFDDLSQSRSTSRVIEINARPEAIFLMSATKANPPYTLQVDANNSTDNGIIQNYKLFLDDVFVSEGSSGLFSLNLIDPKIYVIKVIAVDEWGAESLPTVQSFRLNSAPLANFNIPFFQARYPAIVNLSGSDVTDDDLPSLSYLWKMGDGTIYTTKDVQHVYGTDGNFRIELVVTDDLNLTSSSIREIAIKGPNAAPIASFTKNVQFGNPPLSVHLDASSSTDDFGNLNYRWELGNGKVVTTRLPTLDYTFTQSGLHLLKLTVIDPEGASNTTSQSIRVNETPIAMFSASTAYGNAPLEVIFDASASSDDDSIVEYKWTVDGQEFFTTGPTFSHVFNQLGNNQVLLKVKDSGGLISFASSQQINVNRPPVANILASSTIGDYPLTIDFSGASSTDDHQIASYKWTFPDGSIVSGANAQFTFNSAGDFPVLLEVTDDLNLSHSSQLVINVQANPVPVAQFAVSQDYSNAPAKIKFDASSSTDDKSIQSYEWTLSSGESFSSSSSPIFEVDVALAINGSATLKITDSQGSTSTVSNPFVVTVNQPPVTNFSIIGELVAPSVISLDASASTDDEGIVQYHFDYGDGSSEWTTSPKINHIYSTVGNFNLVVLTKDRQGATASSSQTITLQAREIPLDSQIPTISFSPDRDVLSSVRPVIEIFVQDDSAIDPLKTIISLNGQNLPENIISYDAFLKKYILNFDATTEFLSNANNALSISVTDTFGNNAVEAKSYFVAQNMADTVGPQYNFIPDGGTVDNLTPQIVVYAYDESGLDFSTLRLLLNGNPIPNTLYQINQSIGKITIQFDESFSLDGENFNFVSVALKDLLGNDRSGLLGIDPDSRIASSNVSTSGGGGVAPSFESNCAIIDNGKVKCWGANNFGILGYGNLINVGWGTSNSIAMADLPYLPFTDKVLKITTGLSHHCALFENKKVKCWGRNLSGNLGSGGTQNLGDDEDVGQIPYVSLSKPVVDIDTTYLSTCALFNDGTAQCWGVNTHGELGIGNTNNIGDDELPSPSEILIFDEPIVKIAVGWSHTCALFQSQRMRCWGEGGHDHLGYSRTWLAQTFGDYRIGDNESPAVLPFVDAGGSIVDIGLGNEHSCALYDDKRVKCWGWPGPLGLGTTTIHPEELKFIPYVTLHGDVKSLRVGWGHNCVLYFDDTFTCWGANSSGELGRGNTNYLGDNELITSLPPLTFGEPIGDIYTGSSASCASNDLGQLRCWGLGTRGALGYDNRLSLGDDELVVNLPYINLGGSVDSNSYFSLGSSLASFEYNPQSGGIPLQVEFTAQADPNIFSYEWTFGDGVSVELYDPNASHIYNEVGVFTVHLKVKNSIGLVLGEMDRLVNVTDPIIKPFARFSIPNDDGVIPLSMQLDASNSFDLAGTIVEYHWLFGDGTSLITSNPIASHLYNNVGVFSISLQVKNDQGALSDFYYDSVVALSINQAPVADFACSAGEGSISCDASTSLDYDGLINGYRWSWGDGQYSEGLTATHNFSEPNLGNYPIVLEVVDNKGDIASTAKNYSIDQSNPLLNVELADGQRFNQNLVSIPVHITDSSVSSLVVSVNGVQSYSAEGFEHLVPLSLSEGLNLVEFEAFDSNLNSSGKQLFSNIHLDTTLPVLSISTPIDNSRLNAFVFPVSATSSKPLSKVLVNGFEVTLSQDQQSFDTVVAASAEGPFQTTILATDLYGNIKTTILTNEIFLPIFNPALITTIPDPDQAGVVKVIGAPSAMRLNNHEFLADGGLFNSKYATSNADGSFEASLLYFDEVKLTAINPITNTTENIIVKHLVDTTLLGQVLDVNGLPLMGVTVSITSSGQSAITDGNGNFEIASPVTGDQTILVDATTLDPSQLTGRSFSKLSVLVTLGMTQRNILGKPIYLTPTLLDGSETIISQADGGIVASEHALGVALTIPANTVIFPDNSTEKAMNIMEIPADRSSVEVPAMAVPNTVYALEPSGVTFTEPIEVTLPNKDELPVGVEVILFSKNSKTGYWEPDGVAVVDENGTTMTTKAGQGITHFSEVYAAPLAPVIRSVNNEDIPGANTFDGAVTSQIVLPSYQVMGSSVAPQLIYNSSWANPTALIKNIIDMPRNEVNIDDPINFKERGIRYSGNQTLSSWVEPEYIEAQFQTGSTITDKVTFTGMPNKSLISYGVDLSTENSGAFPYLAQYWIKIKNTVISTLNITAKSGLGSRTSINRRRVEEFAKIYPQNIGGNLYINNLKNSSYGQGWDVAGVQKILKTDDVRLAIKEGNGQISSYVLDSSIDTIFEDLNGIQAINLNDPNESFYIDSQNNVKTLSLSSGNSTQIQSFGNFAGTYGEDFLEGRESCIYDDVGCSTDYFCVNLSSNYSIPRIFTSIAKINSDQLIFVDENGLVYKNESLIAGQTKVPNFNQKSAFCSSFNIDCGPSFAVGEYAAPVCFNLHASSGVVPESGNINGDSSVSKLNRPFEVIKGVKANTLIFSDSGNHQIKEIDLSTNTISVVAGNGTNSDNGDGGDAKNAGIRYPRGLSYDTNGNLYVVTASGYIRRIDANGIITTFAGLPVSEGGELVNKTDANRMALVEPTYLAIDNDNQMMFVSDTANNRIVQIDMQNGGAQTFAGNGTCVDGLIGDKGNALEASLCSPGALGFDANKNLLVHDKGHKRIRRITLETSNLGTLVYKPSSKDQSVLYKNQDGTFERHYRNGSIDHFNINGQQVSSIARNGREINYEYGPDGKLASMIDPSNAQISFNYSGDKLVNIADPANRVTEFNYNGETLSSVTFPDGTSKSFSYDAKGLLTSEQNERGNTTSYQYNIYNRLAKIVRPDLTEVEVTDAASGAAASSTLKSISNGELYDGIKDAKGFETKFISDTEGFVSTIIDAEGRETKIERNVLGDPTKIFRPDGSFATFSYDPITRDLLEKFDSLTNVSLNYVYDSYGNLISSTDELGIVSTTTIDPVSGNLLKSQRLDQFVQYDYFDLGLVKTKTNNLNQFVNYSYDQFGNLSKATDSLGIETIYLRDFAGNNTEVIDGKGQFTRYEFDLMNRLTKVISPKNEATSYSYLPTGELSQILDPKSNETFFNFDSMGRLIQKIDPLNRTVNLSYDFNGNIAREVDYMGHNKDFEYDSLNRLTKKILPDNLYEFTYDVRNNITQVKDSFSQIDLSYVPTEKGYLIESESLTGLGTASGYGSHTVDYTYNNSGNRDSMTSSAIGSTSYEYDNQKRLIGLVNHRNQNFNFEYESANRIKKIITPVMESSMSFDSTNFLTSLIHTNNSGTVINSFEYVRDALGNRIQMRTPAGDFNYSYDQNSQLTNSQSPEVGVESFTYDPLGNRITDQNGNYIYDSKAQRLIEDYNHFYSFDDNGNLSSKVAKDLSKTENYIHDSQNRMVEFAVFEGLTKTREVKYFYDALGRRIRKVSNDLQNATFKITNFLYEGNEVIAKTDDSNQVLVSFTHSSLRTDDPLAMHVTTKGAQIGIAQSAQDIFYVKDAQGSVIDLIDSNGDLIEHYSYGSFGNLVSITDVDGNEVSANPSVSVYLAFMGREFDADSNLYNFRNRWYLSEVGIFIEEDPIAGAVLNHLSHSSRYAFVLNNPVNNIDPTGEFSLGTFAGFAFSLDIAGLFDYSVTEYVKLNRTIFQKAGFNDPVDFHLQLATFGQVRANISEKDQIRMTKVAILVVAGSYGLDSGLLSSTELIGIGGLSGYQAFGQDGNWVDNFLSNSGGNLALGLAGAKVASYLPTDMPYLRLGFKTLGGLSLVNNIVKATEGINKKYKLTE